MVSDQPDPLLPLFKAGEMLTVQRTVNGQNVLMFVEAEQASAIGPRMLTLRARIRQYGPSPYADGRVSRQKETIDRLMADRKRILEIAIKNGQTEIVNILEPPTPLGRPRL